ncbi:MAG: hypothetical protein RID23_01475 [Roseovarius sp.]
MPEQSSAQQKIAGALPATGHGGIHGDIEAAPRPDHSLTSDHSMTDDAAGDFAPATCTSPPGPAG